MFYMDLEVSKLKTWQLYVGFVFIQIVVGIIVVAELRILDQALNETLHDRVAAVASVVGALRHVCRPNEMRVKHGGRK